MTSEDLIKRHEGLRLKPYLDSEGILTVGYGHNLERPITAAEADRLFEQDMKEVCWHCRQYDFYHYMNDARKAVIENMIFNLGPRRFAEFKKTIEFLKKGKFEEASVEMLDSKWATQVGRRAKELSKMMRTGEF